MFKSFVLGLTLLSGLAAQVAINSSSPLPTGVANVSYSFTLSASGGITPYSWTILSGQLPGGIGLASNGLISGTANVATVSGFTVQVTDSSPTPLTSSMAFALTVSPQITTTTLPASTVNEAYPSTTFIAAGLSGTPIWSATGLPNGMAFSSDGVLSGTPTASGNLTPAFSLTDPSGAVGTANIPLTINAAPTINDPTPLPSGDVAVAYSYQFGSSPVSGGTPPYTWFTSSQLPSGLSLNSSGLLAGTPTITGLNTFSVQVTDASTATSSKTFALFVGTLPVVVTQLRPPPASTVGVPYPPPPTANQPPYFQASRGTGNGYTWASGGLPAGLSVSPTTGPQVGLAGTPTASGTFPASVSATDSASETGSVNFNVTINPAPAINTSPLQACTAGTSCTRALTSSGGTAPLNWSLASGAVPAGMSLSGAGVISGTPNAVASPTTSSFGVTVTDSATASNTQQFSLVVNPAMVISPSTLPATTSGIAYSQTFNATGGTGSITFTATGLPGWLTLATGGLLSGTAPLVTTPTTYSFSVKATDTDSAVASNSYSVVVNPLPAITNPSALPAWTINRPYIQTITATGGTGVPTFSDNGSTLPSWLSITSAGVLSGTPTATGPVSFTLRVTDSLAAFSTKTFALTINPPPSLTTTSLPATTSGIAYSQTLAESGGTTPFTWQATSLPSWLNLSASGILSGTAPVETAATPFTFSVTITDTADAISSSQSLTVTVNPAVQITTTSPLPATGSGLGYSQTLASSGGTGAVTWSSGNLPSWLNLSSTGTLSGTAPVVAAPTPYNFNVTATDNVGATGSKPFSVTVNPQLTIATASPLPSWTVNRPYSQTITAAGGTGALTFSDNGSTLPSWLTISSAGLLSGTPTATGPVSFILRVTDSASAFATKTFALTINPPPSVTTTSLPATTSGIAYSQTLAESGGTTPFTWQATGLPAWLSLSASGILSGTAPVETSATPFNFSVTASDAAGAVSSSQSLAVTVNPAVQITRTSPLPATGSGLSYSQTLASSGGTGAVTWSSTNLPSWLTLSSTGALSGTAPVVAAPTPYNFNVTATDSVGATGNRAFSVTVNPQLTITTASPLPAWTINRPYSQTITAAGGTGALTFSDNGSTLPSWLTISSAGLLSGIPTATGPVSFTLRVTDSVSAFATKTFALTINPPPSVTTTSLPAATSGIAYIQTLAESGGTSPFTWQATGLPAWLSLSAAGILSGTAPAESTATPFSFSVTVTDAASAVSGSQSLSVTVNPAIQITTASPLPTTESGLSYSQTLASSGGTGTVTWSSGNLPSWLKLSASGTLTGTAPSVAAPTLNNFNVTATDSLGLTGNKAFSVTVNPQATIATPSPLPAWTVNQPYAQTIAATGGIPGYTFTDAGTTLPSWLTLSTAGSLTGTPPAIGTLSFTLKVTDSAGGTNTRTFSLKIDPTPSVTTTSLPATTSGLIYSQTLAATGGTGTLSFAAAGLPAWLTLTGATLTGTSPAVAVATPFNFSVTVSDGTGAVSPGQALAVTVNPALTITTSNPLPTAASGTSYSQSFAATGGTGAIAWTFGNRPSWLTQNGATLSGTAPTVTQPTLYSFTATATDSLGATSGSQPFTVTVSAGVIITTGATLGPWTATRPFTATLTASGGTPPYTFTDAGQTLPQWLILTGALLSGTPPSAGSFPFTIKAVDSSGSSITKTFTLAINPLPSVTTTSLAATTSGVVYSQVLAATGGTPPLTWSGANLPAWLSLNGPSLTGTAPVVSVPTPYGFSVGVTDFAGATSSAQSLSVTVNPSVTITTTSPLPTANSGVTYNVSLTATGGTGALTWSASNLPSWLTLSGNLLNGVPPASAAGTTLSVTVRATDSVGAFASTSFQITVASGSQSNNGTLPAWTVNRPYSTALTATGGAPPYQNWSLSGGSLPAGLQLNSSNGTIAGTPTAAGTTKFTVSVTDSSNLVFPTIWTLTINPAPAIPSQNLPPASPGSTYLHALRLTGGTSPLACGASGLDGSGLTLGSNCILAGQPTATPPATINFTATVTDAAGATAQASLSLLVEPPISLDTGALPATTSTAHYSASVSATGGTGAIVLSAASGGLPGWLSLNSQGVLTGIAPTVAAATDFDFMVTATDSVGVTASKNLTITVNPLPKVLTVKLPAGTVSVRYSAQLLSSGGTGTRVWSTQNLPAWAQLNPSSGVVSGTPPAAATVTISVTVTDSLGIASLPAPLILEIDPPGGSPHITTVCPFSPTTAGLSFGATANASGGFPPYNWSAVGLPSWLLLDATGALSGTAVAGASAFDLALTDSHGQNATLGCGLTVNPAPAVVATSLAPGTAGAPYAQNLSAFGGTGALIWSSGSLPSWLTVEPLTGLLSGTPNSSGNYTFTVQVTDTLGAVSASASFTISVTGGGGVPMITACPLPVGSVGTPMAFQLSAALGFPPYTWSVTSLPAGLTFTAAGVVTGTPSAAGVSTVGLTATDSATVAVSATCSMSVFATPSVTTTTLPNGTVGAFYWQTLSASGGVGGLRWSISGAPDWVSLDPLTGILSGTPDSAGAIAFTVQVTDSHGAQSPAAPLSVNVTAQGGGIVITTACPLPSITQSMLLDQVFTATGGAPPYSWSATGLPAGVLLNASGSLLGTPATGPISFTVQATDQQQQQTAPTTCSVQINSAPAISTASLPNGVAGSSYLAILNASGGTGSRSWSAAQPYWLNIDPLTGDLSGTPPVAGPVSTTVQVADRYGIAATKTFSFTVAPPSSGSLPALVSACPLPGATVGVSYSETLAAAGGSPPYQFAVFGLPAGLTLSSGVISGTAQTSGDAQLVVQVIDAAGSTANATCGLTVSPSGLSIVVTVPAGKVNQSYSGGFTATGGLALYTWSISSGALPPGISLNTATGALSGTPTVAGTYPFTATVTDSQRATASANTSITIAPALVITTSPTLPDALGGSAYQQTLSSSGAVGSVTWSIASGTLPAGLTLNSSTGAISGSATQAGTFTLTVQAADFSGQIAQLPITLKVNLPPIPQFTITGMPATVTPGQQLTPAVTVAAAYPLDIAGQLNLTVTADSSIGLTDPAVQFAAGGTSIPFRIPANSNQAVFTLTPAFQTGTLAGTFTLNVGVQTGGVSVQPPTSAAITGQIPKLAPVIVGTPAVTRSASGVQVTFTAFSTSREVTSAGFLFTGANVQTSSVTVPLSSVVGAWYSSAQSDAYGSLFQFVQPFVVTGNPSQITGVTITLTNSVGNSTPVTVSF